MPETMRPGFHARQAMGIAALVLSGWAGDAFAEVHLPDAMQSADGKVIHAREMAAAGPLVVVTIKGSWCHVCREQLERLNKIQSQLDACGAEVVVVTPDPPDQASKLQKAVGQRYPVVSDPEGAVGAGLEVWDSGRKAMFPALFVFGRKLNLEWSFRGRAPGLFADKELLKRLKCDGMAA